MRRAAFLAAVVVACLAPDCAKAAFSGLDYSTYLGGTYADHGSAIVVDDAGNTYVAGNTDSANFPTTSGAYDTTHDATSTDAFVAKLSPSGALVYSTFLGTGDGDYVYGLAVDAAGSAYVTGHTSAADFPTTPGAYDTSYNGGDGDIFVTKLNPSGSGLSYSTYLGGSSFEAGVGIAIDGSGSAYLTAQVDSANFPTTPGAFDTAQNGGRDVAIVKLAASGAALAYSTWAGGSVDDFSTGIAVDGSGSAYVTGWTQSGNFPTTAGAFDTSINGVDEPFVTKLNPSGSGLSYSTYMGGSSYDSGAKIAVDIGGSAYVIGGTSSADFPTTAGAYDTSFSGQEAFVAKLTPSGGALVYSTYLGGSVDDWGEGIAVDGAGDAYVTGHTQSEDFPTTADAHDTSFNGTYDAYVTKLAPSGGAIAYSTYLGGSSDDFANTIALDPANRPYVTGSTLSTDFPTTPGALDTSRGDVLYDGFVTKVFTFDGYPRAKAATPMYTPLVPAYTPCAAPNRVHAAPLSYNSCNPASQTSGFATVGSPDANGATAKSVGALKLVAIGEVPINTMNGNQSDVVIDFSITDVRKKAGLADYTGGLRVKSALQITDRNNTPYPGGPGPGTVVATTFEFSAPCATTPSDSTVGSTCSTSTTANAVLPGQVLERQRAMWQLGRVEVDDGGADGNPATGPNTLFATQGVFIP